LVLGENLESLVKQLDTFSLDSKHCSNPKCAICFTHESDLNAKLVVDHNHATKKVRKLLCVSCNVLLGQCKENKEILARSIQYLEEFK